MKKEKQAYRLAELELIRFEPSDVISTSEPYIEDDNGAWV